MTGLDPPPSHRAIVRNWFKKSNFIQGVTMCPKTHILSSTGSMWSEICHTTNVQKTNVHKFDILEVHSDTLTHKSMPPGSRVASGHAHYTHIPAVSHSSIFGKCVNHVFICFFFLFYLLLLKFIALFQQIEKSNHESSRTQ